MTEQKLEDDFPHNNDSYEITCISSKNRKDENVSQHENALETEFVNIEYIKVDSVLLHENELNPPNITAVFIKEYVEEEEEKRKGKEKENEKKIEKEIEKESKKIKEKTHLCTYPGCKAKFSKPSKLKRHLCMHTGERPFVCDFKDCDKAYTNKSYLKRHQMSHSGTKSTHPCKLCEMRFTTPYNLQRHCKRFHGNPLAFPNRHRSCEECSLVFNSRKLLKAHMIQAHDRKLYKCHFCPKTFSEPSILQRHIKSNVHKTYCCNICLVPFNKYEDFKKHNKEEHMVVYSEYTCDICDKKFAYKNNLSLHLQDHMKTNIFMCIYEGCNRMYYFQRNLDIHIRTYHLGEKWECPVCSAKLSSKQKLIAHIDKIHENPVPKKPQPTKQNRKKRWDAGIHRKSAVSELVGVMLPPKTEKEIIYRHEMKCDPFQIDFQG